MVPRTGQSVAVRPDEAGRLAWLNPPGDPSLLAHLQRPHGHSGVVQGQDLEHRAVPADGAGRRLDGVKRPYPVAISILALVVSIVGMFVKH